MARGQPPGSFSRSGCGCITSIGAIPTRRRWCWCMAAATIAATGTGSPRHCAATGTSSRRTCAATATAHGRRTATTTSPASSTTLPSWSISSSLAPVTLIGHSLGGNIAVRYAGIFPEKVERLVAIEGLGLTPKVLADRARSRHRRAHARMDRRAARASRPLPRRYASIDEAFTRMQGENQHLSPEQARHLTQHGVNQNEDGTYSWKFDNYVRSRPPLRPAGGGRSTARGRAITCPTLLGPRQGELVHQSARGRARAPFPPCPRWSRSKAPATGFTTTGWRCCSIIVRRFLAAP